ncbi:MAG: hypothetical protein KAS16_04395, partial [Thermoplasmata archaeon]|nr:hypothetical protein [Thermoplasmata archaeon]
SGTDHIYRYTRDTASWASEFDLAGGNVFRDIEYSEAEGNFYIVGDGAGQPMAWSYAGGPLNNLGAPAVAGATFFGLTIDGTGASTFLAVGYAGGAPYAAWFQEGGGWTPVATGWAGDHALYDVVWNTNPTVPFYYAVGEDAGTGDGIMYSFDTPGDTSATQYDVTGTGALRAIDWRPLTAFGLMGGDNTGGGNVFIFSHGGGPEMLLDTTDIIEDISFHPDDSLAMLVGYNGINQGVIYHFTPDNNDAITKMSTDGDYGKLYGVDVKAWTSPSSGLIVGASGAIGSFLSASDTGTTITVNAAFPHSFDIDMWKMSDGIGGSSKLNTQVDVEEIYTFMAEVNYTISGVDQFYADAEDDVRVELLAFYDELATPGVFPAADDQHRTRAFGAVWLEGAAPGGDSAGMMYPVGSPGTDEFLLDSFWLDASAPGDRYYIYMNVTFGPQTWAASGPFGGASTFLWDNVQSHNDANTWDFEMRIYDNNFVGATNSTFEEFGIFQYTNITVAGNPSGNAPPGSVGVQLGPNSQITCMANRDYYVNVSVPDLARVGGGSPILATNLAVNTTSAFATDVNSEILGAGVYFPGANMTLSVWGNTSQGPADWMVAAPLNSTTAHGPQGEDFQTLGPTEIEWWIDVPGGTAEGVYQATITFKIGYY